MCGLFVRFTLAAPAVSARFAHHPAQLHTPEGKRGHTCTDYIEPRPAAPAAPARTARNWRAELDAAWYITKLITLSVLEGAQSALSHGWGRLRAKFSAAA